MKDQTKPVLAGVLSDVQLREHLGEAEGQGAGTGPKSSILARRLTRSGMPGQDERGEQESLDPLLSPGSTPGAQHEHSAR
jgi:hypothetical protein